ncbi:MAG: hypothetical protein WCS88_01365 [Patescibacteria group bacterium]|jgi:hypothetical protein
MENLENNNQINKTYVPVNPTFNVVSPAGLQDRMTSQNPKAGRSNKRIFFIVLAVVLLIIIGVGGWWYYAKGQALMLLKQAKWDWGLENIENYQNDASVFLDINFIDNKQEGLYAMFFGGQKFNLNITSQQKNIGSNFESDINLASKTESFDLNIGTKIKKVDDKLYFLIDSGTLSELLGGFVPIPDFGDTWLEMNIDNIYKDADINYNVTINKDNLAKINIQVNNFLDKLKEEKVFIVTDLKKDANGFRKIQLNVKEEKIDTLVKLFIDHIANTYETILEVDKNSPVYVDYRKEYMEGFEKMKTEKPEDFVKFKKMFESLDFIVLINSKTKNIQGFEIHINDLILGDDSSSVVINGNIKQLIKAIDYYDINKPDKVQNIENISDILMNAEQMNNDTLLDANMDTELDTDQDGLSDMYESFYGTDINNPDSDGDTYLDGQEVLSGYNPIGEGQLNLDTLYKPSDWEVNPQEICEFTGGTWSNNNCQCPDSLVFNEASGCW